MNYNSKTLLDVKFEKNVKGYDALQVDETLDDVIEDYVHYEKQIELDKKTIEELEQEIKDLNTKVRDHEVEERRLKKIVDSIPDDPKVNRNNIQYLQRIAKLEAALYKRGVDPKKI